MQPVESPLLVIRKNAGIWLYFSEPEVTAWSERDTITDKALMYGVKFSEDDGHRTVLLEPLHQPDHIRARCVSRSAACSYWFSPLRMSCDV